MQRILDLTEAEVLTLTDEQVERYIDVECLIKGVPLLPAEKPVEPTMTTPAPSTEYFQIGNFKFLDEGQATQVLNILRRCTLIDTDYKNRGGESFYTIGKLGSYSEPKMEIHQAFTQEEWEKVEKQVEEFGRIMSEYKSQKKEYDEAKRKRSEADKEVWNFVTEVRSKNDQRNRFKKEFERYVALAGGDRDIAWPFFKGAYPDWELHEGLAEELGITPEPQAEKVEA